MNTAVLEPKAIPYWNYVKDASLDIKCTLVSLLSDAISKAVKQKSKSTRPSRVLTPAEARAQKEKEFWETFNREQDDQSVDVSWIHSIVKDVPKVDRNIDYDKAKYEYLMENSGIYSD